MDSHEWKRVRFALEAGKIFSALWVVKCDIARTTRRQWLQRWCLNSSNWTVRNQVALNPFLMRELRAKLLKDEYKQIRAYAALSAEGLAEMNKYVFPGIKPEDIVL